MTEEKTNTSDEKIKETTANAIDELASSVKKTSRKIFDACVERTAEVFSEVFDDYLNKTKEKIKKKGENDD